MTLNTAVVAPIPSASESTAASANPGLFLRFRAPYRTSCQRIGIGETQYITTAACRQGTLETRVAIQGREHCLAPEPSSIGVALSFFGSGARFVVLPLQGQSGSCLQ